MISSLFRCCCAVLILPLVPGALQAVDYYVDDTGGLDGNAGTSAGAAWQTFAPVNATTFAPGDRLFLKAGGSWSGQLDLNGNGTAANPIVVDRYGTGDKPFIDGAGYNAAVLLSGVSYWEINNLEVINDGGATQNGAADYRVGVLLSSWASGIRRHLYLRNLDVHDVFPETGPYGHGIHVMAAGTSTRDTYFDDVRIENCHIYRTGRYGVWVQHKGSADSNPGFKRNKNITIRDNLFEDTGGSGAETGWCEDVLLEGNVIDHSGASVDPRQWARGSGYWPFKCVNVLVQGNVFRHARGHADSCGVHIDFGNTNVTIQYNLSLDNEGGFVEILGDCIDSTYRYNVSINDGWRVKGVGGATQDGHTIWVSNFAGSSSPTIGSVNSRIYNNTVYVPSGHTPFIKIMSKSEDTMIQNNVFMIDGSVTHTDAGINTDFDYNLWQGNQPSGLSFGASAVFADALVANAGGVADTDYLLSPVSPAIGAGVVQSDNGGLDYWGNPLPAGAPCIGAHERTFSDTGVISVNLAGSDSPAQNVGEGVVYGIPVQNSMVGGWLNLEQTLSATNLPLSSGFPSSVEMSGSAPAGWGGVNGAYDGTPLRAGIDRYVSSPGSTSVTLQNLSASFPNGYKAIVYLCGFNSNTGASLTDGTSTFYFQSLDDPASEFTGTLQQAIATSDPGDGNAPAGQYAVFGNDAVLTADTLTLSLDTLYGGGAILGGFQILAPGQFTPKGVPHGWFAAYGIAVDDLADDDFDGQPAWREYFAGTDPTDHSSSFKVTDLQISGADHILTWRGGITGYQGHWSVFVSHDLENWSMAGPMTIPRAPGEVQTWTHVGGHGAADAVFYRVGVDEGGSP